MSIFSGSTEIQSVYSGSTEVLSVYSGSDLVWLPLKTDATVTSGNSSLTYGYSSGSGFGSITGETFDGYTIIRVHRNESSDDIVFDLDAGGLDVSPPFTSLTFADGTVLTAAGATSATDFTTVTRWQWDFDVGEMVGKTPTAMIPNSGAWSLQVR